VDDLGTTLRFWHWLALGVVFVTAELFAPGAFFLGMGVAALVVGAIAWLAPDLGWQVQVLGFAVLSLVSIVVGRQWLKARPIATDQPLLNQRGHQYIGRVFTLEEPIRDGVGKVRVDDSTWKVRGPDAPAGARVEITGVDGVVLLGARRADTD